MSDPAPFRPQLCQKTEAPARPQAHQVQKIAYDNTSNARGHASTWAALAATDNKGRTKGDAKIRRKLIFKHRRKSALTAASNDPKVPDRQIDLLAGHSSGSRNITW